MDNTPIIDPNSRDMENYPLPPATSVTPSNSTTSTSNSNNSATMQALKPDRTRFPYPDDMARIANYEFYERLFFGKHFEAFNVRMKSDVFGKEYARLKYVVANFPGLISKVVSDLLFIEPPKIKVQDGDQVFLDALINENKLRTTNYESALSNSYFGDSLYKVRVGKRNPYDLKSTIIIEEVTPKIYFPLIDPFNQKGEPGETELAWTFKSGNDSYLRKEIHIPGFIRNQVFKMEGDQIKEQMPIDILGIPGLLDQQPTGILEPLVIHVPNWRSGSHFGISDYYDLETLFFAINNRITKVDNILDTHSDPILALPDGIVDEKGNVRKSKIGLFARPEGATKDNDPAYITWDANLDSALKEIDKLIEVTFMMSETAPDILGMGQGQSDSGRALKFKLIRTLAKTQRKQLYYREGLIEALYIAQLLAKEHGIEVDGKKIQKDPVKPEIEWRDGLPADMTELVDIETKRIDAGLSTKVASIMRLDDVDQDTAEQTVKDIEAETPKVVLPTSNIGGNSNGFGKNGNGQPANPKPTIPVIKNG